MCRHLAYLGPDVTLGDVLVEPPWGLYTQSWAPREQQHGTVNVDGFGVGWYVQGDPLPARYRRDRPIWADGTFADLARVVRSGAFLAAVRSATPGMAAGEAAAAPFAGGGWLFSHNGAVKGYPDSVAELAAGLPPDRLIALEAATDSALLWAMTRQRLDAGATLGDALTGVVAEAEQHCEARLNLLLTDGRLIAATAVGNSLAVLVGEDDVVVASEPYDDDPGWVRVQDRSLVLARPGSMTVSTL